MYVVVRGGLGNQMFQVAHALRLARRFHVTPRYVDLTARARVGRQWDLGCFGVQPARLPTGYGHLLSAALKFSSEWSRVTRHDLPWVHLQTADELRPKKPAKPPLLVSGYWQGPDFFDGVESVVRSTFRFPDIPLKWKLVPDAHRAEAIALHVRRGDYVSDPRANALHLVCDAHWYRKAWMQLCGMVKPGRTFVFSDDADWAREHLDLPGDIQYVPNDPSRPAWVDMSEMSSCQHFIISNSSFSWWAAYLGLSPASVVIAPAHWFRNTPTQELRICPSSWLLL
jgi:hypothetical protein